MWFFVDLVPRINNLFYGGRLNTNISSYQFRDPHVKDKTVAWHCYLYHGNPLYLGDTVFILRRGPGDAILCLHCPHYRPFVRRNDRSPVCKLKIGQLCGPFILMLLLVSLSCWTKQLIWRCLVTRCRSCDVTVMGITKRHFVLFSATD